jgi:hypothetical protein
VSNPLTADGCVDDVEPLPHVQRRRRRRSLIFSFKFPPGNRKLFQVWHRAGGSGGGRGGAVVVYVVVGAPANPAPAPAVAAAGDNSLSPGRSSQVSKSTSSSPLPCTDRPAPRRALLLLPLTQPRTCGGSRRGRSGACIQERPAWCVRCKVQRGGGLVAECAKVEV